MLVKFRNRFLDSALCTEGKTVEEVHVKDSEVLFKFTDGTYLCLEAQNSYGEYPDLVDGAGVELEDWPAHMFDTEMQQEQKRVSEAKAKAAAEWRDEVERRRYEELKAKFEKNS